MKIECSLQVEISVAYNVRIDVGAAIGFGLIIGRTHVKFAAEKPVERHLIFAGIECLTHAEPSPFGCEFGKHTHRFMPLVLHAASLHAHQRAHSHIQAVERLHAACKVESHIGVKHQVIVHALAFGSIFLLGEVVILHPLAYVESAVRAKCVATVEQHIKCLALCRGLKLSPIENKLKVSSRLHILHQQASYVGLTIIDGVAPQKFRCPLHQLRAWQHACRDSPLCSAVAIIQRGIEPVFTPTVAYGLVPHHTASHCVTPVEHRDAYFGRKAREGYGLVVRGVALAIVEHASKVHAPHHILCYGTHRCHSQNYQYCHAVHYRHCAIVVANDFGFKRY